MKSYVSVPGCPLGFLSESGDLALRRQPLFADGSEIPAQLIVFLSKLFQLGIHPGNLSFAYRLDGDGLCLDHFFEATEDLQTF